MYKHFLLKSPKGFQGFKATTEDLNFKRSITVGGTEPEILGAKSQKAECKEAKKAGERGDRNRGVM